MENKSELNILNFQEASITIIRLFIVLHNFQFVMQTTVLRSLTYGDMAVITILEFY